jgi:hypothetical protein
MTESPRPPLRERPGLIGQVWRQWAWVLCLLVVVAGIVLIAAHAWRRGSVVIGGGVLLAGCLRLVLRDPGILGVRRRAIDALLYLGVGAAIIVVAIVVPGQFG